MKNWWQSKTIWTNAIAMLAVLAGIFGAGDILTPELQTQIVAIVMAVVNVVLRFKTDTGIKK